MNWTAILAKFYLQVDDSSQLSDDEALELANDIYQEVADDREWEWLKASATGTTSTSVDYIALPSDFKNVVPNYNRHGINFGSAGVPIGYTGDNGSDYGNTSVVFVGSTYTPYMIIPYSQRMNHRNANGFCYIDVPNARLVFTKQPTSAEAIQYDYIKIPTDITASTSPIFDARFHKILAYGMAVQFNNLELTDKNQSYQRENMIQYEKTIGQMRMQDALIKTTL